MADQRPQGRRPRDRNGPEDRSGDNRHCDERRQGRGRPVRDRQPERYASSGGRVGKIKVTIRMEKSFETSLAELEDIVGKLEDGDLPLEESLGLFEKGIKLARECRERLSNAERRIEVLMKEADGSLSTREFEPDISENG